MSKNDLYYKVLLSLLKEEKNKRLNIEKDQWHILDDISDEYESLAKSDIVDIINTSYEPIGGHAWIKKEEDLDWYDNIHIIDNDEDNNIDAVIVGKKDKDKTKIAAGGSDGSAIGKEAYIEKDFLLRKTPGYWGEVSGALGHKLLKLGAPAIENEDKVRELIGNNFIWYGECPVDHPSFHGNVPTTFKNVRGWYERQIGSDKHMKFIVGSP